MFAKLKKKIEDEVGDLGQLTSPLTNPFGAAADRRVGGSSLGSNTPNNLGSRQSSIASLVDLHPIDEHATPTASPNSNFITSNSAAAAARQKQIQDSLDTELKKSNAEWTKKIEAMKKSYEERIQNQEADFAWKYSSKDDELDRVRSEKKKLEDIVKNLEGTYQNKMTRVQDDMDQLEGFAKQEMAKVKHLLLNTQADLQKAKADFVESEGNVKDLKEENRNLKAENDSILRNLDRLQLRSDSEHGDTKSQTAEFLASKQQLENEIQTLKEDILSKNKRIDGLDQQIKQLISEKQGEIDAFEARHLRMEESLKEEQVRASLLEQQVGELRDSKFQLEKEMKILQEEVKSKNVIEQEFSTNVATLNKEKIEILETSRQSEKTISQLQAALQESQEVKASNIDLENEVEKLKEEIKCGDAKMLELQTNTDRQGEFEAFKTKYLALEASLKEEKVRTSNLEQQVGEQRESKFQLEKEVKTLQEEVKSKSVVEQELSNNVASIEREKIEILESARQSEKTISQLRAELQDNSEVKASNVKLENEVRKLKEEVKCRDAKVLELERQTNSDKQVEVDGFEAKYLELEANYNSEKIQVSNLQRQVSELQLTKVELETMVEAAQEEMKSRDIIVQELSTNLAALQLEKTQMLGSLEKSHQSQENLKSTYQNTISQLQAEKSPNSELTDKVKFLNEEVKCRDEKVLQLQTNYDKLASKFSAVESKFEKTATELNTLREAISTSAGLETKVIQLEQELESKQRKLSDFETASVESSKQIELLRHSLSELETNITESNDRAMDLQFKCDQLSESNKELDILRRELEDKTANIHSLENELKDSSIRIENLLQVKQSGDAFKIELEKKLQEATSESMRLQNLIKHLESRLSTNEHNLSEHNDVLVQVSELQSTKDELDEEVRFLKEELQARDVKIMGLEDKIKAPSVANSNSNSIGAGESSSLQDEDLESLRERVRELEAQLSDKNKALKLRQQQLQDLKKSLAREVRNTPIDSISKSASQASLREMETNPRVDDQLHSSIRPETEPAVIQSSNSHTSEASNCSTTEDVNFQYMKSVIFKYVTSSDPQMTHHLTKVVSTLLHLNDEEQRLLQKSTDKRVLSWLGTRDHVL